MKKAIAILAVILLLCATHVASYALGANEVIINQDSIKSDTVVCPIELHNWKEMYRNERQLSCTLLELLDIIQKCSPDAFNAVVESPQWEKLQEIYKDGQEEPDWTIEDMLNL